MRRFFGLFLALALVAGVLVVTAPPAQAVDLTITGATQGPPGTKVDLEGSNFFGPCEIHFPGEDGPEVGNCPDNNVGAKFLTSFVVPNLAPGDYEIWACDFCGVQQSTTTVKFQVTAPTTTSSSSSTTTTKPPTTTTKPPTTTRPPTTTSTTIPDETTSTSIVPISGDLPPLLTGRAIPLDALGYTPITFKSGLIKLPEIWLHRCAPPPGSTRVDFDDKEPGTTPFRPLRDAGVDSRTSVGANSGIEAPRVGTLTAPHAAGYTVPSAPSASFFEDTLRFYAGSSFGSDDKDFTYFGLYVGLAEDVDRPVVVELAANDRARWWDVDRIELGPERGPATNCLLVTTPAGETFDDAHLRVYSPTGDPVRVHVDSVFWSMNQPYPLEFQPDPVEVDIFYPTPTTRLSTARNSTVLGRATWPEGRTLQKIEIASPNWDGSSGIIREAEHGRIQTADGEKSVIFWLNDIEVPSGPFTVSATATGMGLRGSDSVDLEGIGPPAPPRTEYRDLIEGQVDVIPWAMEITQAVRGPLTVQEPGSTVQDLFKHVAGKRTVVRGYATHQIAESLGIRPDQIFANAVLHGTRNGVTLPLSPLRPENAGVRLFAAEPGPSAERASRPFAQNTFNFVLPYGWTAGDDIELRLEVNPAGSPNYIEELPGLGGWNNTITQRVGFNDVGNVGVSAVNVEFHWSCNEDMVATEDAWHPCFGGEEGDEVFTSVSEDEIRNGAQGWWKTIPAPGDFPSYMTFSTLKIPHKDDSPRVRVDQSITGRAATVSWNNWRDAYWSLYCDDDDGFNTQIRPPSVRHFVWMTQPPYAPLRGGGCAWVNKRTAFRANTWWAVPAQESGHTLGMRHTGNAHGELGGGGAVIRFGGDHGQIEPPSQATWGFDTANMMVLNPGSSGHVHDYMSYGGGVQWTAVDTWDHVYRSIVENRTFSESRGTVLSGSGGTGAAAGAPGEGDAYIVEGTVSEDGEVRVDPPHRGDAGVLFFPEGDDITVTIDGPDGPVSLDAALVEGTTHLGSASHTFAVAFPADSEPDKLTVVVGDGEPLLVEAVGSGTGISLNEVGPELIRWNPGDALPPFVVEATDDGGESWWLLGETEDPLLEIEPGVNPLAGEGWTIRVQGADGPRIFIDEEPIDFGVPPPIASIGSPLDGERVPVGAAHAYAAVGVIGDDGSTYTWSVGGEIFNDGPVTDIPILPGDNTITLTVDNESGSAEHTITVLGVVDTDGDGLDDEWEEANGLDPAVPDILEEDVDEDGLSLGMEYQNQTDPAEADTDGDGYSDGLELIGSGDPLDPMLIAGPIHGLDDAAQAPDPDVPADTPPGIPVWVWLGLAVLLIAPLAYWLGKRSPTDGTGGSG